MKTKTPICHLCSTRIRNYGFTCFSIMEKICFAALYDEFYYFAEEESQDEKIKGIVKFLEGKSLLISTEVSQCHIGIKPYNMQGENFDIINKIFCWCPGRSKLQ